MPFVIADKWITVDDCRAAPDEYFIFGDNMAGWGKGGQAQIRDEPNAIGIPTKISPYEYMSESRQKLPGAINAVSARLNTISRLLEDMKTVWYPKDGVGTGLAKLEETCPFIRDMIDEWVEGNLKYYGTTSQIPGQR